MRFASFVHDEKIGYGVFVTEDRILDLPAAARKAGLSLPADLSGLIAAGAPALAVVRDLLAQSSLSLPLSAVRLTAPIPRPGKNVFCVGRNYLDHVAEGYRARGTETKLPEAPQFFTKPPTAVIGPGEPFAVDPSVSAKIDYEVELALIIGKAGRDIPADRAWNHVFGFTILNDITARDLQRRHDQWFKGKGLDRSCPMGPFVVTRDEIADPSALELSLTVNGEPRQRALVGQMIFPIPTIIASLSAGLTLEPGDIIATGTPSGVGYAMDPPRYLKAGDEVVCEISDIGRLVTPIIAYERP
ncbi:MAG TPA: fumarylacetoacetate hydrolase family protein [Aliidongia sp.]|uniref:fumarylacetoacetate hydrolase family protein n=1 Tax=Aliidongia sp. TaxID=1914230 RepID=UPI002DDDB68A|nr:fumarylacetoacetate hydrolase family protein [Aliidongia sp.]HEV2678484.1 fumarylacetoacetate hydrolase family protein [Aliidongia sp.]